MMKKINQLLYLIALPLMSINSFSDTKNVKFSEDNISSPAFELRVATSEKVAFRLHATEMEGTGERILGNGSDRVNFKKYDITGPANLETEYSLQKISAGVVVSPINKDMFNLNILFGANWLDLDLDLYETLSQTHYDYSENERAIFIQLETEWKMAPKLSGSFHAEFARSPNDDFGRYTDVGLRLTFYATENLGIFAGVYDKYFQSEKNVSNIEIDGRGFVYGLALNF